MTEVQSLSAFGKQVQSVENTDSETGSANETGSTAEAGSTSENEPIQERLKRKVSDDFYRNKIEPLDLSFRYDDTSAMNTTFLVGVERLVDAGVEEDVIEQLNGGTHSAYLECFIFCKQNNKSMLSVSEFNQIFKETLGKPLIRLKYQDTSKITKLFINSRNEEVLELLNNESPDVLAKLDDVPDENLKKLPSILKKFNKADLAFIFDCKAILQPDWDFEDPLLLVTKKLTRSFYIPVPSQVLNGIEESLDYSKPTMFRLTINGDAIELPLGEVAKDYFDFNKAFKLDASTALELVKFKFKGNVVDLQLVTVNNPKKVFDFEEVACPAADTFNWVENLLGDYYQFLGKAPKLFTGMLRLRSGIDTSWDIVFDGNHDKLLAFAKEYNYGVTFNTIMTFMLNTKVFPEIEVGDYNAVILKNQKGQTITIDLRELFENNTPRELWIKLKEVLPLNECKFKRI